MKPRTIILLGVAVVCGLGAAYLTTQLTARQKEGEKVTVFTAKANIAQGTPLRSPEELFEKSSFPRDLAPENVIVKEEDLRNKDGTPRMMKRGLVKGAVLTAMYLENLGGLNASLPEGLRGFSLATNVNQDAGGFILPNSKVDVVCTTSESGKTKSAILLKDALVLAVNSLEQAPEGATAMQMNNVVLAVGPEQIPTLASASGRSTLRLVLRKAGEEEDSAKRGGKNKNGPVMDESAAKLLGFMSGGETQSDDKVNVLVASRDIPKETVVGNWQDYFTFKPYLKESVPGNAIVDPQKLEKRTLHQDLVEGQFVVEKYFQIPADGGTKPAQLEVPNLPGVAHVLVIHNGGTPGVIRYNDKGLAIEGRVAEPEKNDKKSEDKDK